jgi:hypothetical protein
MTDAIREFETIVGQHPTMTHYAVPREMALALLAVIGGASSEGAVPRQATALAEDETRHTPVAPDALAAALAYVERKHVFWTADTVGAVIGNLHDAGRTLAAAVRELRGENLRLTHESNGRQFRLQQAEAALAEARKVLCHTCSTCRHQYESEGWIVCRHLQLTCETMGNTCGAYSAKEPTP